MERNNVIYIGQPAIYQKPRTVDTICQVALTITEAIVTVAIGVGTLGCLLIFLSLYY